jgi:hypothetical protein
MIVDLLGKKSLISLIVMILKHDIYGDPTNDIPKGLGHLQAEEAGELAYAKKCAHAILTYLKMTVKSAVDYISGPDYLHAGNEVVELPAADHLHDEDGDDPVFPSVIAIKDKGKGRII